MTEVRADLSTAKVLLRACETRNEEDRGDYKVVTWTLHCPSLAPGHNNNMSQVSPHNTQHQAPHTYMSTLNLNESTYWYQKYPQTFFTPILNTKLGWKALSSNKALLSLMTVSSSLLSWWSTDFCPYRDCPTLSGGWSSLSSSCPPRSLPPSPLALRLMTSNWKFSTFRSSVSRQRSETRGIANTLMKQKLPGSCQRHF